MTKKPKPEADLSTIDPGVLRAAILADRSEMARRAVSVRWAKKGAREARSAEMKARWKVAKAAQAANTGQGASGGLRARGREAKLNLGSSK
jgi:hypothetical protein